MEPTEADREKARELLDVDGYEPTVWEIAQALQKARIAGWNAAWKAVSDIAANPPEGEH